MVDAGYSGTPLPKKLGVKPGARALLVGVPDGVAAIAGFAAFGRCEVVPGLGHPALAAALDEGPFDYIHVFETEAARLLPALTPLGRALVPDGMLWVSWPKKAAKVETTLTEDVIRADALTGDLVDVKLAAIDQLWSGLKLVIRRDRR